MNEYGGIRGLETKSCFNPRARAGRDMATFTVLGRDEGFNPRARAGRDLSG